MKYIGLDVGTSNCKAAVIDELGKQYGFASREYCFEMPQPGYVELNPEALGNALMQVLKEIAPLAKEAVGIAVSSIGESMVMLDAADKPLANAIVYLDQRCRDILPRITDRMSEQRLFEISLVPLNQMFSLSKLIWYRDNAPAVLEKAKHFCLFGDYITYILCGEYAIDPCTASRTMFFDARSLEWSSEIASAFQVPIKDFSPIASVGTNLGAILPSICEKTGLSPKLRVLVGAHDQVTATLGAGAIRCAEAAMGEGTSESLNVVIDKNSITNSVLKSGFGYEPYVLPDRYILPVGQTSHGVCIKWFVNMFRSQYEQCRRGDESIYETAGRLCAKSAQGTVFLPYLSGVSATDSQSCAQGTFLGLNLNSRRDTLYRAVLEGLAFETRALSESVKNHGFDINSLVATGGCSKSAILMDLKSKMLHKRIDVLDNCETGIAGLGIICAVAFADYADYTTATAHISASTSYNGYSDSSDADWQKYKKIRDSMKEVYSNL